MILDSNPYSVEYSQKASMATTANVRNPFAFDSVEPQENSPLSNGTPRIPTVRTLHTQDFMDDEPDFDAEDDLEMVPSPPPTVEEVESPGTQGREGGGGGSCSSGGPPSLAARVLSPQPKGSVARESVTCMRLSAPLRSPSRENVCAMYGEGVGASSTIPELLQDRASMERAAQPVTTTVTDAPASDDDVSQN
eukprot:2012065-Amphidinium_carterae.1